MDVNLAFDDSDRLKAHKSKMEELKQKFAKQVAFIDKMRENIIINSNNFETLKNLTLTLNEKVLVLENALENNEYMKHNDKIAETFEEVKKDKVELNNFWKKKFHALEAKTVTDHNKLDAVIKQKAFEAETAFKEEQFKLNKLLEDNQKKIHQVELKLEKQKKHIEVTKATFKCEECGKVLRSKSDLKLHVRDSHPKHIQCELCESSFSESWSLEMHLETHNKKKEFKCDECGKEFFLKWRFSQHMKVHTCPKVKNCHYYNNDKNCPFEVVGCKFRPISKYAMCQKRSIVLSPTVFYALIANVAHSNHLNQIMKNVTISYKIFIVNS